MGCWRISASAPGRKGPYWPNPLGTTAPRITMKRPRPASSTIAGRIRCPESRKNFSTRTPTARNAYVGFSHGEDQTVFCAEIGRFMEIFHGQSVSYTHLRAHETGRNLVCRLLLEKKKNK